jgi:hypothetical protein
MIRPATRDDIPRIMWRNLAVKTDNEVVGYDLPSDRRIFDNEGQNIAGPMFSRSILRLSSKAQSKL